MVTASVIRCFSAVNVSLQCCLCKSLISLGMHVSSEMAKNIENQQDEPFLGFDSYFKKKKMVMKYSTNNILSYHLI